MRGGDVIHLSAREAQENVLGEEYGDTDLRLECMRHACAYASKDEAVIQVRFPLWHHVEWWGQHDRLWRHLDQNRLACFEYLCCSACTIYSSALARGVSCSASGYDSARSKHELSARLRLLVDFEMH